MMMTLPPPANHRTKKKMLDKKVKEERGHVSGRGAFPDELKHQYSSRMCTSHLARYAARSWTESTCVLKYFLDGLRATDASPEKEAMSTKVWVSIVALFPFILSLRRYSGEGEFPFDH